MGRQKLIDVRIVGMAPARRKGRDVRVKVSTLHGGRGSWWTAPSTAVRPQPHEIVPGSLPAADVALVSRWIDLNRDVIIDYWNGVIDFDEVKPRLQQVQP
jgi:hypothetical protein